MLQSLVQTAVAWSIPLFLFVVLLYAAAKKSGSFCHFYRRSRRRFPDCVALIPYLVAMLVAIGLCVRPERWILLQACCPRSCKNKLAR